MYENLLPAEEQLIRPLIRRSKKGTKLNLPEYFGKPLICSNQVEHRAILFQNQQCQKNILSEKQNELLNTTNKSPSNSKVATTSSTLSKLQKCFSEPLEKSLHIMETVQNELKACHNYPANSNINKANDKLPNIITKKNDSPQGNKVHMMKDKHIFKSADSIFLGFCQTKVQKPEKKSSLFQLFPIDTLPGCLSASSVFQPLHKRSSIGHITSITEVYDKISDKTSKISMKSQDKKIYSRNEAKKQPSDVPTVIPKHDKTSTNDTAVRQKLTNVDINGKHVISNCTKEKDNTALSTGYKECCRICSPPLLNVSSSEIIHMYDSYFKELGIEPEGLAPINICEQQDQKYKHS